MIEGMRLIQGQKDPVLARYRRLFRPAGRHAEQAYAIEGRELLSRAPRYGAMLEATLWTETFMKSDEGREAYAVIRAACPDVPHFQLKSGLLARATSTRPLPPCVGIARRPQSSVDDVLRGESPLVVAIDRGENGHNLGMLLRSAEAAGVSGVLLGAGSADPFGRRVIRAARGAVFHLPIAEVESLSETLTSAKERGFTVYGSSAKVEAAYHEVSLTGPTILMVGNEHDGLSPECLACADENLKIPMAGQIHSLNIAVAASILLFEARRQRT